MIVLILEAIFIFAGNASKKNESSQLQVVTTLFPLYDFVREVGGDKVNVTLLLPPGVEAHSYEPMPSDIVTINNSDLLIYTGKFMEPWVVDLNSGIGNSKLLLVDSSQNIELISASANQENSNLDPHIWLDFHNAEQMVKNISAALIMKDPSNTDSYQENSRIYLEKLAELDLQYQETLLNCQSKEIVYGGHYAFGYLAKEYNLSYYAAQGFSPDTEPTATDLVNLVNTVKQNKIKFIFYEELSSPKIAEMLASETNTKLLLLNTGHNLTKDDFNNGQTFIGLMQENLNNLITGLQCQ
ncbi:MAG: zinc ABC transporter substrate-binding protein [bacterium]